MDQFVRLLTLQDANTRTVLLGAGLLGIASAVVGAFAVLRKRALVGDAVAHAALPGICVAFLLIGDRHFGLFMLGALISGVLAAVFISFVKAATRIKEDAAIALAIGGFFGVGIVLSRIIQNQPSGNRAGLDSFIFGKAASMIDSDVRLIAYVAAAVLLATALLYKEFKVLCFDRDFAVSQGWPAMLLDLTLMGLVCVCTIVGLPAVGVVLMVSLLVIPPVAARFWTNRLGTTVILAAAIGGLSGVLGAALSAVIPAPTSVLTRGWPTGPLITLVAGAIFVVSMLLAPRRGVLADLWRRYSLRRRISAEHLLRAAYEAIEPGGDLGRTWRPEDLGTGISAAQISRAERAGHVAPRAAATGAAFALTPAGQAAAAQVVRAHRLWELFLIEQASIAPDHVDRDADQIEHVLPPRLIAELDARLAAEGRAPLGLPPSPHEMKRARGRAGTTRAGKTLPVWLLAGLLSLLPAQAALALGASPAERASDGCQMRQHLAAEPQNTIAHEHGRADHPPRTARPWSLAEVTEEEVAGEEEPTNRMLPHPATIDSPFHGQEPAAAARTWFSLGSYQVRSDDLWVVATAVACAVSCGLLGCFLVLRRISLLGDAISHAILPGLAIAFMLTHSREPMVMLAGAGVVGVLTAFLSTGLSRWGRIPEDAAMGVVFTILFAIGVVLITWVARDVDLDPGCVLYGLIEFTPFDTVSIAGAPIPRAFAWLGIVLIANILLIWAFFKELKIVCFDAALATSMGISAVLVHYALMTAVAATTVASFESVGSILVVAMLVAPGATAHLLTDRLWRMLWIAALVGALSAVIGYILAVWLNTSVAGMIAAVALGLFILTAVASPRHGYLGKQARRAALALRIAREDALGMLYRWHEQADDASAGAPPPPPLTTSHILAATHTGLIGRAALWLLARRGLIRTVGAGALDITPDGIDHARRIVRGHRLWESYLARHLAIAPEKVHAGAHRVEHYITDTMQQQLGDQSPQATDPHGKPIPPR